MIRYPLLIIQWLVAGLLISQSTFSQHESDQKGRLYLSPDFGLVLGNLNRIEVSPALGYYLADRISVAAGFKYEFYSITRVYTFQEAVKTHIIGPRLFARYTVLPDLGQYLPLEVTGSVIAHAEIESTSLEKKYFSDPLAEKGDRFWHTTVLVGGGFSQPVSERISLNILVLWDTDGSSIALYNNPIVRFGFQIYLDNFKP